MAKTNIQEELRLLHTIPPVFNRNSKILILGSFPSVKSREAEFFYGHKQNRFWKVLANLLNESVPENAEEKKQLLLSNGIALWDVIKSCTITGSSDSSIKNVVPNDIEPILQTANISQIFTNGSTADKLYKKHIYPFTQMEAIKLPSTSPANAAFTLDKLLLEWNVILKYLKKAPHNKRFYACYAVSVKFYKCIC